MKRLFLLLTVVATLAFVSTSNASITNAWWHDDRDGTIVCDQWSWNPAEAKLWMSGDQFGAPGQPYAPAHMVGWVELDSDVDPTLTLSGTVENDTGNAWYGYQINVRMDLPFTFTTPGPTVGNPPLNDWFWAQTWDPVQLVSGPYAGMWQGSIFFSEGTSILNGGSLDFLYSINFSGTWGFEFTQEMIPWATQIPEPSTAVLGGLGVLLLVARLRGNRR
ncbi:MAG TPA: hypothetical protein P5205_08830 [Candidatus Paceibacterota bacterium]|nr:hypothetical protein [Verrucomicrobiota bacterium]HSA10460.1 hypothetical protein [Candidatus Paceibacterota bacterium]